MKVIYSIANRKAEGNVKIDFRIKVEKDDYPLIQCYRDEVFRVTYDISDEYFEAASKSCNANKLNDKTIVEFRWGRDSLNPIKVDDVITHWESAEYSLTLHTNRPKLFRETTFTNIIKEIKESMQRRVEDFKGDTVICYEKEEKIEYRGK